MQVMPLIRLGPKKRHEAVLCHVALNTLNTLRVFHNYKYAYYVYIYIYTYICYMMIYDDSIVFNTHSAGHFVAANRIQQP